MKKPKTTGEQLMLDFVKGFNAPRESKGKDLAKVISLTFWKKKPATPKATKPEKEIVSNIINYSKTLGW